MDSILITIKRLLGVDENYDHFDVDIIIAINTAFMTLNQIGVGPESGFMIQDKTQTWTDFLGDRKDLQSIITFVYYNARLIFDPPQNSFLVDSIKQQISEISWRLNVQVENSSLQKEEVEVDG